MKIFIHLFLVLFLFLCVYLCVCFFVFCFKLREGKRHVVKDHVRLTCDRYSEWCRIWKAKEREDSLLTADHVLSGMIVKIFTKRKGLTLEETDLGYSLGGLLKSQTVAGS